jgi:hypothetical protein
LEDPLPGSRAAARILVDLPLPPPDIGHVLFVIDSRDHTAFAFDASTVRCRQEGLYVINTFPKRRFSCFQGFLTTRRTQAPAITGFQTRNPRSYCGVERSLPRDLENSRNSGIITAQIFPPVPPTECYLWVSFPDVAREAFVIIMRFTSRQVVIA